jgi:hypothetical protein
VEGLNAGFGAPQGEKGNTDPESSDFMLDFIFETGAPETEEVEIPDD